MDFLKQLNPAQREAVQAVNGPVMVVAGAGSGKTRVLTYKIAYLLGCGVPPYQLLALTFTNKAAGEMRQRALKLIGSSSSDLWIGTFHSLFARILRRESSRLGYTSAFAIYDTDDSLVAIKRAMETMKISIQEIDPRSVRSRISNAKNALQTPADLSSKAVTKQEQYVARIFTAYENMLRTSNAMDFDDLIVKMLTLFRQAPEVLAKYQERFRFLLVDEFQDTNKAQYEVAKALSAKYRNICVVGDDAQSIYSFRGADIRNILEFSRDFHDTKVYRLEQNYRSTKSILSAADALIKNNVRQIPKSLWTSNPQGDAVTVIICPDDRIEALRVTQLIAEELHTRKLNLRDAAILYRTNAQSRVIEDYLRRASLPYVIVGGIRFYERKEIKDVLAYFRLIVNPHDEASFLRVINVPARGIGDVSLNRIKEFADSEKRSLFSLTGEVESIPELQERAKKSIRTFREFIEKHIRFKEQTTLIECARAIVDDLGIVAALREEGTPDAYDRLANIQELLNSVSDFAAENPDGTLESYLETVTLVNDIDMWDDQKNAVTLMTLHAAKGLEFALVFITGLEEGLLPLYQGVPDSDGVEEERRLFYVGITRARQKLYILRASARNRYGELQYQTPSRFLAEIQVGSAEVIGAQARPMIPRQDARLSGVHMRTGNRIESTPAIEVNPMPKYEDETQVVPELMVGTTVEHETFGRGKVIELSGTAADLKAVVRFDRYGVKKLFLRFARLRIES